MGGEYIVSLLASHATLIVTLAIVFAGALAAGLAGFAFSAITGAILFHLVAPIRIKPASVATERSPPFGIHRAENACLIIFSNSQIFVSRSESARVAKVPEKNLVIIIYLLTLLYLV